MSKKFLIGSGIALGVIVAAAIALPKFIDVNRYKPQIEAAVKEKTGRALKIDGDLGLALLPRISLSLPKTTLSTLQGNDVALSVNTARVSAAWLPLLRGQIEVGHLTADGLNATLERRRDGSTNLDDLFKRKPEDTTDSKPAKPGAPAQFEIGGITLSEADLTIDDKMNGTVLHLTQLNLKTGRLATRSSTPIEFDVAFTNSAPEASGKLKASGKMDIDLVANAFAAQRFEAELKASVEEKPLEGTLEALRLSLRPGTEGSAFAAEGLNLKLKGPVAGAVLESSRVVARKIDFDPVLLDFSVQGLEADIKGQYTPEGAAKADDFELKARLSKLLASRDEASGNALDVQMRMSGSQNLEAGVQLDGLSGRAQALTASKLALSLGTTLQDAQGHARHVNVQFSGPARASLEARTLTLPSFNGEVSVSDARLPNNGFKMPIELNAKLDLKQETLTSTLRAKLEEAHTTVNLDVKKLLSEGAERLIGLEMNAERLNLDRYIVWATPDSEAAKPTSTTAPTPAAKSAAKSANAKANAKNKPSISADDTPVDWSGLSDLNLNAEINVGQLQAHGAKASNVRMVLKAAGGRLDVKPLTAGLYGGSLNTLASVFADNRFTLHASLVNVAIEPLLKDAFNKDLLAGRGTVKVELASAGDSVMALRRGLDGNAAFGLRDGALKGINLGKFLRETRARFGSSNSAAVAGHTDEKTDFSEISATFQIADGIATSKDLEGKSPLLRLAGEGQANLVNTSLDYVARVSVVGTSEGQGGRELADLNGITVPVHVTGPMDALSYQVDWGTTARDVVKQKAREELKEKVTPKIEEKREELKNKLKNLLGK